MIGRLLPLVLLVISAVAGCGSMQRRPMGTLVNLQTRPLLASKTHQPSRAPKAAEVTKTAASKEKSPEAVRPDEQERKEDHWLARTRRRLAQVAKDIKADLDFHETEGLEAFSPDALRQVQALRGEMNGPSGITR